MSNPYFDLTEAFNRGRLRVLLSSGQAVVAHRLAVMSKDGDWLLREDDEAAEHVLRILAEKQAWYRFGAPLDLRWLAGGWSAHLEHRSDRIRLRTDFVTRPPRIDRNLLAAMWGGAEATGDVVVGLEPLAALKLTNRDKDYAVVGELARQMADPRAQLLFSRSARDLIHLAEKHPEELAEVLARRPVLGWVAEGRERLEEELDRERRSLMRINEERLDRYRRAAAEWEAIWPEVQRKIEGLPLPEAHSILVSRAEEVLPFRPDGTSDE